MVLGVLQRCYWTITGVSQRIYRAFTEVFQWCYRGQKVKPSDLMQNNKLVVRSMLSSIVTKRRRERLKQL